MTPSDKTFNDFAQGLIDNQRRLDPEMLQNAQDWYRKFTGKHAVTMPDSELIELYKELH